MEQWKDIKGYEGLYQVSNLGRVKGLTCNKIKSDQLDRKGYVRIQLYKNNKPKMHRVHRLVAKAFIENTENKSTVNHIDGNKTNNNVSNLEWLTNKENLEHAYATGLKSNKGNDSPARKFSENEVIIMKNLLTGETPLGKLSRNQVARIFGTTNNRITRIDLGYDWKHVKIGGCND